MEKISHDIFRICNLKGKIGIISYSIKKKHVMYDFDMENNFLFFPKPNLKCISFENNCLFYPLNYIKTKI